MANPFYLQSESTSSTSLTPSITQSSRPDSSHNALRSLSPYGPPHSSQRRQPPISLNITLSHDFPASDSDDDSDTSLPFPAPLPRADFLTPGDFDPSTYLSSVVRSRYQTLEDLRLELRTRVQALNSELVNLVNAHQDDFLSLGKSLRGGEEKVEEVRVGVLGLRREIEGVRGMVLEKERSVGECVERRRNLRKQMELGRALLDFQEAVVALEVRLGLSGPKQGEDVKKGVDLDEEEDTTDDDADEGEDNEPALLGGISVSRLSRRANSLLRIARMAERIDEDHPFIQGQRQRIAKCREVILRDLTICMRSAKSTEAVDAEVKMNLLQLYRQVKFGETGDERLDWL